MRGFLSQLDQWRQEWTENILVDIDDPGDVLRFKMRGKLLYSTLTKLPC